MNINIHVLTKENHNTCYVCVCFMQTHKPAALAPVQNAVGLNWRRVPPVGWFFFFFASFIFMKMYVRSSMIIYLSLCLLNACLSQKKTKDFLTWSQTIAASPLRPALSQASLGSSLPSTVFFSFCFFCAIFISSPPLVDK